MPKIKILQIYCYDYAIHPGGLEKIAQTLSNKLNQKKNIKVLDVTSDIRGKGKQHQAKNIDHIYLPSLDLIAGFPIPKVRSVGFRTKIADIKKYKPTIIQTHTRFFIYTVLGGILAKLWGCKWIHVEHGSGFVTGYSWYIKLCARLFDQTIGLWIFRQADTIITISHAHEKFIKKFTHKIPELIYNPIEYSPQKKVKNKIPHIGFVGRLVPIKGVDILLQALVLLSDHQRTCTIVGDGPEKQKLEILSRKLGLTKKLTFVGVDDKDNWLHKFDIFVNPSYQEGLPTTVVEALLAKCIVVATDVGGTREITDGKDMLLSDPGNVEDLREKIEKSLHILQHAGHSESIVQRKFSADNAIQQYEKVIMKLTT